ncbi:response regulator transcription factor [Winogradskyella maritima]|uniref:Response regulator transcription factor n=1 Tax=Winogradskyella maritima TaxID=1517766 RepID=A0ABV8AIU2_9FLAO|nr:response regulator transcription factor [Winogradskyella maritima]
MTPSILIADDHPLILKGLEDFLKENNYNVVASAKNGRDALELIKELKPDIAILDIQMPFLTGLEVAEICDSLNLETKIALITFEKDETFYKKALTYNIYGYILKEFALDEIEICIEAMSNNDPYFSPELEDFIEAETPPEELALLTDTESKILRLVGQNRTAKKIADILFISDRTVEKHKSTIRSKLKLDSSPTSLILFAKQTEKFLKNT